jgi:glucokinase
VIAAVDRKSRRLNQNYVLACDVGGTTMKAEVTDGRGLVVESGSTPTPHGEAALAALSALGKELLDRLDRETGQRPSSAGVALPGRVDRQGRLGVSSVNIGWRDLEFGSVLDEAWQLPVVVDHDVTVAGWAEWLEGAGRGYDDVVFVALGTGVAASLVVNGRLVRGGVGQAGEFGHLVVRPGGRLCACGARGCLESVASASAIARAYAELSGRQVAGAHDVLEALEDDPQAQTAWQGGIDALADGLAAVTALLAPSLVIIGGGMADAGEALLAPLRKALRERSFVTQMPELSGGMFGSRAGLVGAAMLARRGSPES